jgi:hypothetical protein
MAGWRGKIDVVALSDNGCNYQGPGYQCYTNKTISRMLSILVQGLNCGPAV